MQDLHLPDLRTGHYILWDPDLGSTPLPGRMPFSGSAFDKRRQAGWRVVGAGRAVGPFQALG
jgi:hypothetical protein